MLIRRAPGPELRATRLRTRWSSSSAYYNDHMIDHTVLYPGVRETLDRLLAAGVKMAVLTNKPVRMSRAIVEALGVGGHFCQVYGGNSFEQKKPHPIGIETLMAECDADRGIAP